MLVILGYVTDLVPQLSRPNVQQVSQPGLLEFLGVGAQQHSPPFNHYQHAQSHPVTDPRQWSPTTTQNLHAAACLAGSQAAPSHSDGGADHVASTQPGFTVPCVM